MAIYKENYEKNYASFVVCSELSISSNVEFVFRGKHHEFHFHEFCWGKSYIFKTIRWTSHVIGV